MVPISASLTDIAADLARARIAIVGDVMLDRYLYGEVDRVSPEAPVPVVRLSRQAEMLGGAANVAANVAALGAHATLVGLVGGDAAGAAVRTLLTGLGDGTDRLVRRLNGPTTVKTRIVARHQQMLRLDEELATVADAAETEAIVAATGDVLPSAGALLLSDYAKGVLGGDVAPRLIALAKSVGRTVIVDPKGRDYARYRGADVLTPNLRELHEATGLPVEGDGEVTAACQQLIDRYGLGAVVATRSERGMTVVTPTEAAMLPTMARDVFDVSGAGDTVVATLACGLAVGLDLVTAAKIANAAAGIVVGKVGTAQTSLEELMAALRQQEALATEGKLMPAHVAAAAAERWRRQTLRVGFTNGCFDLLHPGHLSLLRQARAACDRLVVGLNSDASVARLKGAGRPIQGEMARAAVLASLEMVDAVVLFGEDTPLALIQAVRPDVLVKGADYTVDQVVGGDFVRSLGGKVVLAELVDGHSTTRTVERLRRAG